MPVSQDNQDYKKDEDAKSKSGEGGKLTESDSTPSTDSDDLKGKKVDADPTKEEGKPADV